MRKIIITSALFASTFAIAQKVGINTTTPKTTLHIVQPDIKSGITTAKLGAGTIITGNSSVSYEGIGQYFENLGNLTDSRVVKHEFVKPGDRTFLGYNRVSDDAGALYNTFYGVNLETGNFTVNIERGFAVTTKLDVDGNARIRGLVDGADTNTTTGFPNMVVAKKDGTLGYAPRSAGAVIKKSGTTSFAGSPINLGVSFAGYTPVLIRNRAADNQTNTTVPKDRAFAYNFSQTGGNWQLDFWQGAGNSSNYTAGAGDVLVAYEVIFIPKEP